MDGMEYLEEYKDEVLLGTTTGGETSCVETIYQKVSPQSVFCDEAFIGEEEIVDEICLPVNIDANTSFNSSKQEEEHDPLANNDAPNLEDMKEFEFLKKEIISANGLKSVIKSEETQEEQGKDSKVTSTPRKTKVVQLRPKYRKRKKLTKGRKLIGSKKRKMPPKRNNLHETFKPQTVQFPRNPASGIKKVQSSGNFKMPEQEIFSIKTEIQDTDMSCEPKDSKVSLEESMRWNQNAQSKALQEENIMKPLRILLNKNEVPNFFKRKQEQEEMLRKRLKSASDLIPKTEKNIRFDNENRILLNQKQSPKLDEGSSISSKQLVKLIKLNQEHSVKSQKRQSERNALKLNVQNSEGSFPLTKETPNAVKNKSGNMIISAFRARTKRPDMDLSNSAKSLPNTVEHSPVLYPVNEKELKLLKKRLQARITAENKKDIRLTKLKMEPTKTASSLHLRPENSESNATKSTVGEKRTKYLVQDLFVETVYLKKNEFKKTVGNLPRHIDEHVYDSTMNESLGKRPLAVSPSVHSMPSLKPISPSEVSKPSTTIITGKHCMPIKKVFYSNKNSSGYERLPKSPVDAVFEKIQTLIDKKVQKEVAKSLQNLSSQISNSNTVIKQESDSPKKKLTFGCDLTTANCIYEALKQYFGEESQPKPETSKQSSVEGEVLPAKNQSKVSQLILGKPKIPVFRKSMAAETSKITANQKIVVNPLTSCGFKKARSIEEMRNNVTLEHNYVLADDTFSEDFPTGATKFVYNNAKNQNICRTPRKLEFESNHNKILDAKSLSSGNNSTTKEEGPPPFILKCIPTKFKVVAKSKPTQKTDTVESDPLELTEHCQTTMPSSVFKCMDCELVTGTREKMEHHVKSVHGDASKCYLCGAKIKFADCLAHFQSHHLDGLSPI